MTSDNLWIGMGMAVFVVVIFAVMFTLIGALFLWALSVFGIVTFSWLKALALGLIRTVLKSIFSGK